MDRQVWTYIACSKGTSQGDVGYKIHYDTGGYNSEQEAFTKGRAKAEQNGWRTVVADTVIAREALAH